MLMAEESKIIVDTMKRFGVTVRIRPEPFSYLTARSRVYWLDRAEGVKIEKVVALGDEIEEILSVVRGEQTPIRFLYNPLAIVTPRTQSDEITAKQLLDNVAKSSPGAVVATLGQFFNHSAKPQASRAPSWLRVDFSQPETPHLMVIGTTGSGKTGVLKNIGFSLAVSSDPDNVAMVAIDLKAVNGLPGFSGLPHLAHPVATDPEDAMRLLNAAHYEMERRREQAKAANGRIQEGNWPALVIVIDELSLLLSRCGKESVAMVKQLAATGRGLKIHLVIGQQKATKETMSAETMANLPVRAVGSVAERAEGYYATGIPGSVLRADRLTGRGDMILALNGNRTWGFQSANITPDIEARIVAKVLGLWQGRRTSFRLAMEQAERDTPGAGEVAHRGFASPPNATPAPLPAPAFPSIALTPPKLPARDAVAERHDQMRQMIRSIMEEEGRKPSPTRVQGIFKQTFNVGLNWNTACQLLESAGGVNA